MRFPSLKSWFVLSVVSAGIIVLNGPFSQAWQNQRNRTRVADIEDTGLDDKPERGDGWVKLHNCQIKLIDNVTLGSERPGVIEFLEPEEGDSVQKGQEIIRFKDEAVKAIYNVAKHKTENDVHIRYAAKSADVAKANFDKILRANQKLKDTFVEADVDKARLEFEKAILQGEQAEHEMLTSKLEMEKAEEDMKALRIKAPFDGKVRRILKRPGEPVAQGAAILELVSTRRVKVEGQLPLEDLENVKPGDPIQVQVEIPDLDIPIEKELFEGRVVYIDPTVSPVNQTSRVWAEVQNHGERLIEGMPASMKIKYGARANAANGNRPKSQPVRQTGGTKTAPKSIEE